MRNVLIYVLLAGVTCAVYWRARQFSFVNYDDGSYVYENSHVAQGLTADNIAWAFRTFDVANYHPLTWISYLVDSSTWGAAAGPMHLENVVFHAINALLLFAVLRSANAECWPAVFVAAVFALHPVHVESVAWVSQRKDLLSTLFLLLGMWAYLSYARRKRWSFYLLMIGCYGCGLLAKPMIVTFPFLLMLLDYWPLARPLGWWNEFAEKSPLLMMSAISAVLTYAAQQRAGVVQGLERLSLVTRLDNILVSYVRYLGKSFWPADLAVFYPYRANVALAEVMGSGVFLFGLTLLLLSQAKKRRYLIVGWFWFLGTLVPVIGLVQAGTQSMADRYLYVPMIGLAIMVAWAGKEAAARSSKAVVCLALVVLIAVAAVTHHQLEYWRDTRTLFQHALAVTGNNSVAHLQLGLLEAREGNQAAAISHYDEAIRLEPMYYVPEFDLGNLLLREHPGEALGHYAKAAAENPGAAEVQNNWGLALMRLNRPGDAYGHFQLAIGIDRNLVDAHLNLARLLADSGFTDLSRREFGEVLRIDPNSVDARRGLSTAPPQALH